jgi:hypothetical protein
MLLFYRYLFPFADFLFPVSHPIPLYSSYIWTPALAAPRFTKRKQQIVERGDGGIEVFEGFHSSPF